MTTLPFTYNLTAGHVDLITDLECEIECEVGQDAEGYPRLVTNAIMFVNWCGKQRVNPLTSDSSVVNRLGFDAMRAAESDDDFRQQAFDSAGLSFTGLNANDPDGRYVRAA